MMIAKKYTSSPWFTNPCFFKIVEEIVGIVVELSSNQVESHYDITKWNKRESNQFFYIQAKILILFVFYRQSFVLNLTPDSLREMKETPYNTIFFSLAFLIKNVTFMYSVR